MGLMNVRMVSMRRSMMSLRRFESTLVLAGNAASITSVSCRIPNMQFAQEKVVVLDPVLCHARPAWIVTRVL